MPASYDLRYETRAGRCAWCWEPLPERESHTVVAAVRSPPLELRFHHRCWPAYQAVTNLELHEEPWTPQRVEELRLRGGWSRPDFARRLHINPERLRRFFARDETALGPSHLRELRSVAAEVRFRQAGKIDWSDPRAFFCLCRHLRWSILAAHRATGAAQSTIKTWHDNGVPRVRPGTWAKLTRIAERHDFDASMIRDDYCWTAALLAEAITASGQSVSAWAAAAGITEHSIRNYRTGRDAITRAAAWHLTTAAVRFGVPLPPVGRVHYVRPPQERHRPVERKKRWTKDMLSLLGTMPDSEVARRLGLHTGAVAKQRERLGIAASGRKVPADDQSRA